MLIALTIGDISPIMGGEFPTKAKNMVKEFILKYQKELEEMWETEKYKKLPPLNYSNSSKISNN